MKKPSRLLLLACLTASPFFLANCVPSGQDITNLDLRIRNLDNRMVSMDKRVDKINEKTAILTQGSPLEQVQMQQAELSNNVDRLNMEFLQLKGMLEEASHSSRNLQQSNADLKKELQNKIEDLAEQIMLLADQVNQYADRLNTLEQSDQRTREQLNETQTRARELEERTRAAEREAQKAKEEKDRLLTTTPRGTHEISPERTKKKVEEGKTVETEEEETAAHPGKDIYDKALGLFRESKYNEAYRTFTEYIELHPDGKLAPNARFWLGDCYYNQQEYELAILEYQKVIADYPNHGKAPAALLKQGLAFEKLKDNETAKIVYKKVIEDYPKSEQVETAKARIEKL